MKFAIIGAGHIAHKFAEALHATHGQPYAIASRSMTKAKNFQKQHDFETAYGSYKEMLEDENVDVVYVATPHSFHYEHILLSLEHGKHVICEKPLTLNARQAKTVFHHAKKKKLFVMEAMWTRVLPAIKEVNHVINEGTIGDIRHIEADFCLIGDTEEVPRLTDPNLGGGALLDIGIYPIMLTHLFLGKPDTIDADTEFDKNTGVDLDETFVFSYPGNVRAELRASFVEDRNVNATITGSEGKIIIPDFPDATEAFVYDGNRCLTKKIHHAHRQNGFEYEIDEVIKSIESGQMESGMITHQSTLERLDIMDDIREGWNLIYPQE